MQSLSKRMSDLERAIDTAMLGGQDERAQELQQELEEIVSHARRFTRPGDRSRTFDDTAERARTSVQKAIRRAISKVGISAPHLADALRASVRTGHRCSYEPTGGAPEAWDVRSR